MEVGVQKRHDNHINSWWDKAVVRGENCRPFSLTGVLGISGSWLHGLYPNSCTTECSVPWGLPLSAISKLAEAVAKLFACG